MIVFILLYSFRRNVGTVVVHWGRKLFTKGFLLSGETMAVHRDRKLLAKSFLLSGGTVVVHGDRKRYAKGFLLSVGTMWFMETGNDTRRVSY